MKIEKVFTSTAALCLLLLAACTQYGNEPRPTQGQNLTINSTTNLATGLPAATLIAASNFAVLAGTTVTNAGASLITGDLGVSPGTAITGFQPSPLNTISGPGTVTAGLGIVTGTIYASGPVAAQAHNDAVISYNNLVAQTPNNIYSGVTQLDGMTFTPGVYNFAPSANLQVNGIVYLDFQGNSDALFIFQMGSTLVTMTGSQVIAINSGQQTCSGANVYWAVGSSATLDGAEFVGNVIATTTITMTADADVSGRIWAINGAVTMITDSISVCTGSVVIPHPPKPCTDFVTGGGWIKDKSTFGVSGGIKNGKFWGQLSFNNHLKNGMKVKSTSVTNYIVIDAVTRQINGIANVNGQGSYTYKVVVVDNGEPGRNDSFSLEVSNGYSTSGVLKGGNIQLHKKCSEKGNKDGDDNHDRDEWEGNRNCNSDRDSDNDHHRK